MKKNGIMKMVLLFITAALCVSCRRKNDGQYTETTDLYSAAEETEAVTESVTMEEYSAGQTPAMQTARDHLQEVIDTYIPGIVCWGDSLTVGAGSDVSYPDVLREFIETNITSGTGCEIPVVMMGVGGEYSYTIAARAGGLPLILTEEVTIPAESISVQIDFLTADGYEAEPLLQGDEGMEYVEIGGVRGTLEYLPDVTGESGKRLIYYFKRSEPGETVTVPAGTQIVTQGYLEYRDYLKIIFIGENGGYQDVNELIKQQMSIVNTGSSTDRFLIIGLTSGTAQDRADMEAAMEEQYGSRYLNARSLLSSQGMSMMEIETTVFDQIMMDEGRVPGRLLSDSVHLNEAGYRALGSLVYERLYTLGYFAEVLEAKKTLDTFN